MPLQTLKQPKTTTSKRKFFSGKEKAEAPLKKNSESICIGFRERQKHMENSKGIEPSDSALGMEIFVGVYMKLQ
ncbi:MAG: hypothetical protein QXJ11_03565 [Candidatus Bathyarchaeia archaeon]